MFVKSLQSIHSSYDKKDIFSYIANSMILTNTQGLKIIKD